MPDRTPSHSIDSTTARALALRQPGGLESSNGRWSGLPEATPAARPAGADLTVYLHALRRHWVLAAFLGLLCAAAAAPAVWFGYGPRFEATALLRVNAQQSRVVFSTADTALPTEYEIFKNTQQQVVKSRLVATAALRQPEVKPFDIDKSHRPDAVGWLVSEVRVSYPGKGEIMQISLASRDPEEAKALASAVVNAYLNDIVGGEIKKRNERLNDLDRVYEKAESNLRSKREQLKSLADTLGTADPKTVSLKQQVALQQFAAFQQELMKVQFELRRAKGDFDVATAQLKTIDDLKIPTFQLEEYIRNDPQAKQLFDALTQLKMQRAYLESAVGDSVLERARREKKEPSWLERSRLDMEMVQARVTDREKEMQEAIRDKMKSDFEKDRLKKQSEVASLTSQEEDLRKEVQKKREEAEKLSSSSIDLEMQRTQIDQLETVLKGIADERERLKVEVNAPRRIEKLQDVQAPDSESNTAVRMLMTLVAALVSFCIPVALIAFRDVQAHRVNSAAEVSQKLGVPVMGSVPVIPARAIRRLGSPSRRVQSWQTRLTESVDGIAARFHRQATLGQTRVVLISSAMGGEGKTTLASQLALSLARSGRRTVLVDFDLRRPALDGVFGVPLEPGLCDVLRGNAEIGAITHPTASEHLSVVPAGRWDRAALAALTHGAAGPILEKLRTDFEFVVLDSSPILPVADTRFVSQHVDTAILSVFRDVSQGPKVQAAREILEAFGVPMLEAVVTGPNDVLRDRDVGYEASMAANDSGAQA